MKKIESREAQVPVHMFNFLIREYINWILLWIINYDLLLHSYELQIMIFFWFVIVTTVSDKSLNDINIITLCKCKSVFYKRLAFTFTILYH